MSADFADDGDLNQVTCLVLASTVAHVFIHVKFIDKKNKLDINHALQAPSQISIKKMIEEFIEISGLDHLTPRDIRLARIIVDEDEININQDETRQTLADFDVMDDDTIIFEPTHDLPPPNLTYLTVISPDEKERVQFEWCKSQTTLKMLQTFVIERFSLQNISVDRIHLVTYICDLPVTHYPNKLLINFYITTGIHVRVQVIGLISLKDSPTESTVRVECLYDQDKVTFFQMPTEATIEQLRKYIEKNLKSSIYGLKILSQDKGEIDTSNLKRSFSSFGITGKDKIYVNCSRKTTKAAVSTKSVEQPKITLLDEKITVLLKYGDIFQIQIPMSTNTKIFELIKMEANLLKSRIFPEKIRTKDRDIDMKETDRCIRDYGVKGGETVYVELGLSRPSRLSIVGNTSEHVSNYVKKRNCEDIFPLGLENLGNTCYMNSSFQCLARIPPLTNFFIEKVKLGIENERSDPNTHWNPFDEVGILTGNYANLLWNLLGYNEENDHLNSIEATNMRDIVRNFDSRFNNHDQQDAQEFINFLLHSIHREIKEYSGNETNTIIKQLFFGRILSTVTCTTCNHEEPTITPIGFLSLSLRIQERKFNIHFIKIDGNEEFYEVTVPMNGYIKDVVLAFTQQIGDIQLFHFTLVVINGQEVDFEKSLEDIPVIEITIYQQEKANTYQPPEKEYEPHGYSLYDCFEEFLSAESLENQWTCPRENCGRNELAKKQSKFIALPPVLVIHFKRFSHINGVRVKVDTHVNFPIEGLDLSPLVSRSIQDMKYDLVAVCYHLGGMYSGHYTATTRCETNGKIEWFYFDDALVKQLCPRYYFEDIVTRDAYLLFYVRRDLLSSNSEHSTLC